ncbi:hypothetical protein CPLU01_07755 [Colletotrichum plurivorum]|uniref:Uncharacterized protein n=1 Tax=Colletotrichum plurivorum TaxID=2175906 RepID=A0A8H6KDU2_9PEZI|nr:hypothetical protein CPLU01_07755 [Colletotrichum plurivorum]
MSRSSFSIRRLISPRRSQTADERRHSGDSTTSDDLSIFKSRRKQQKSKSWAPARHASNIKARRPSREEFLVRRTQSIKRMPSEVVPLPEGSPHSSSSSLCSGEGHTDTASVNSKSESLCSSRVSRPSAPKRLADRRHLCLSPLQTKQDDIPRNASPEAVLKALEAGHANLSDHPALRDTSTPPATPEDETMDGWSLNVQQLIRETDAAFKAVGTAIEDAKIAVSAFPMSLETSRPRASTAPSLPRLESPIPWVKESSSANCTPPLPPPTRTLSGSSSSRPRRKKSKKAKRSKSRSKKGARWQLGEDVADILSGQFFRKMEVNELLSPDHLQALRAGREAQARMSSDTMRTFDTDGSETPVEPFHLQDLPSRIGAAGVGIVEESSVQRKPTIKETPPRANMLPAALSKKASGATEVDDEKAPPPPAKNPLRFAPRPQAPLLPTIPEVVVTAPDTLAYTNTNQKQSTRTFAPVDEDDFIFFQSTNYTMTQPCFRHGAIRFPKSEVVKGMKFDPDDTLDWTAFQMAILGGAGDLFSDPSDFSQRSEAEEIADLIDWFEDFGFDNHGQLEPTSAGASPSSTAYSPSSSVSTDINLPIPVEYEYPSGFWNEGQLNTSKFLTTGCGIQRWTVEGRPKRYNRESIESLPPSPMMDLVMMRGSDGEPEVVPMGYNLGHDLGDFLRWEAENVYATGVY